MPGTRRRAGPPGTSTCVSTGADAFLIRAAAILAVALTALLLVAASPAAGQYGGGTLTIDDPTLLPGQEFRLRGTGCLPGGTAEIFLGDRPMGTATADADGAWEFVGRVPLDTPPGEHLMRAICGDLDQSIVITVPSRQDPGDTTTTSTTEATPTTAATTTPTTAPGDGAGSGRMPRTGWEVVPFVRAAVVMVLTGTGIALLARRRTHTHPL